MPTHRVTFSEFERKLMTLVPEIKDACVRGLKSGALRLDGVVLEEIDNAVPFPAVDRGELRNSREVRMHPDGADVSVTAPHAVIIEEGTRPFWPPLAPLVAWVMRKGIGALQGPAPGGGRGGNRTQRLERYIARARWSNEIEDNARRVARLIQKKIARDGIKPRHYFAKAWARAQPMIREEIDRELARLARKG